MVHELKGSKSAHEFFKSKKIDIDSEEIHELTDYRRYKIGKIINFIFKEQSKFPTEITKSKRTENTNINIKKLTIIPKKT
jgi:hypothetical protein